MNVEFELSPDVPDLVAMLASQFMAREFTAEDACLIVMEMLADAMSGETEWLH